MSINLKNRCVLKLRDFSTKEIKHLLDLALELKAAKLNGNEKPALKGKNIAFVFEKPSMRTRCAFEVAVFDQGGQVTYIDQEKSHIRTKESIKDTARVLGRMYHGIAYRGYEQETVEVLARYSGVPVWNALTDEYHPTQVLADLMTMIEHCDKPFRKMSLCYMGDAQNNVASSLMVGAVKMGIDFRIAAPKQCQPVVGFVDQCIAIAKETGSRITITEDIAEAVKGVDFIYTDVWVSMGQPFSLWEERIQLLKSYQVNQQVVNLSKNSKVRFMHCLPALHNRDTKIGEKLYERFGIEEFEVTDEVFESPASIVFDQAENKIHSIKAIIVATLS